MFGTVIECVNEKIHTYISPQTFLATVLCLNLLLSDSTESSIAPLVGTYWRSNVLEHHLLMHQKHKMMILLYGM